MWSRARENSQRHNNYELLAITFDFQNLLP